MYFVYFLFTYSSRKVVDIDFCPTHILSPPRPQKVDFRNGLCNSKSKYNKFESQLIYPLDDPDLSLRTKSFNRNNYLQTEFFHIFLVFTLFSNQSETFIWNIFQENSIKKTKGIGRVCFKDSFQFYVILYIKGCTKIHARINFDRKTVL